jgi:hypothetical protein
MPGNLFENPDFEARERELTDEEILAALDGEEIIMFVQDGDIAGLYIPKNQVDKINPEQA